MKKDEGIVPFLPVMLLAGIFGCIGAILESIKEWRVNRCYQKHYQREEECTRKECFLLCCEVQERKWVQEMEDRARNGNQEAVNALEFYYRYG